MDVTPQELRSSEIKEERRGYHRDQTDDLLERAAATIEALSARVAQLNERAAQAETSAGTGRETEDLLQRTLLLAQRTADETVAEAKERAESMVREAEERAGALVRDAESEARRLGEAERRRIESEVAELAAQRHALTTDVDALERFEEDYRARLREAIASDLETLSTRPTVAAPHRPALHDVDVPAGPERVQRGEPEGEGHEDEERVVAGEDRATVELGVLERAELGLPASDEPEAGAEGQEGESRHVEGVEEAEEAIPVASETDDERERGSERLFAGDEPEADALDDDAFFASLREAVRDDAPLGPADDDLAASLYDQDDSDDDESRRFTDVFRRRR